MGLRQVQLFLLPCSGRGQGICFQQDPLKAGGLQMTLGETLFYLNVVEYPGTTPAGPDPGFGLLLHHKFSHYSILPPGQGLRLHLAPPGFSMDHSYSLSFPLTPTLAGDGRPTAPNFRFGNS